MEDNELLSAVQQDLEVISFLKTLCLPFGFAFILCYGQTNNWRLHVRGMGGMSIS